MKALCKLVIVLTLKACLVSTFENKDFLLSIAEHTQTKNAIYLLPNNEPITAVNVSLKSSLNEDHQMLKHKL